MCRFTGDISHIKGGCAEAKCLLFVSDTTQYSSALCTAHPSRFWTTHTGTSTDFGGRNYPGLGVTTRTVMALALRLTPAAGPAHEPEDFFGDALGVVFEDDTMNLRT